MIYLLPSTFLFVFSAFNIFGIKSSLAVDHLINYLLGLVSFFLVKKIGSRFFRFNSHFFYWSFIFILVITYIIGIESKGAKRWLDFYFFNFQPSEFFKIFYIFFLADFFARNIRNLDNIYIFLSSLFYFFVPFILIYKQPDLGTALVFASIYFSMFLFSSLPKKYLIYLVFVIIFLMPLNWFFLKSYQKERLTSFFNHEVNTQGTSYNMIQAVITTGSGQFFGRGLGRGTQSRLYFLPENHNDFAFSSLIEQFGFFGGLIVFVLYLGLIFLILKRILFYLPQQKDEESRFNFLFTIGFLSFFIFQIIVNVGMNLGLLPIAGIGLPFISYGGSSIIAFMIGLALLP